MSDLNKQHSRSPSGSEGYEQSTIRQRVISRANQSKRTSPGANDVWPHGIPETPIAHVREQNFKLILIGVLVGACWGLFYAGLLFLTQISPNNYGDMKGFTYLFVFVTGGMCLACVWLSRWFTQLDGGILWLANGAALLAAAEILWYFDRLQFSKMTQPEMWCLTFSLATHIFVTGFLARPKDKLFH